MKSIHNKKYLAFVLFLAAGILLGWLFFHSPGKDEVKQAKNTFTAKETIWTCAMHPQIRMHEPGKCPICGMDLIPLNQDTSASDPEAIHMSKDAIQLANVLTTVVSKQKPVKEVRLYGKVQADERLIQSQVSYIKGRIEKLFVNFTGEGVRKGQLLAMIYSPELMTAQQELLETVKTKKTETVLYEAAKEKLRQWRLSEDQIASIEKSGKVKTDFEIYSSSTGIVTNRRVNNGDYINPGSVLFDIADLSRVWVMFDAYESDIPYLSQGQNVTFTLEAMPGLSFSGAITFIDPVLDPIARVAKVRVELNNQDGKLKPEMFATGIVEADLSRYSDNFIIPRSAVLWTGKRSLVYVKQPGVDEFVFKMRAIELGPMLGNSYVVINGLNEGDEIVTQGVFSVDASAQLEGKPSMMNPQGGKTSSMPGMIMPGDTMQKVNNNKLVMEMNKEPGSKSGIMKKSSEKPTKMEMKKDAFHVSGNCEMCKARIEKAAKSVKGVTSAVWDIKTKQLSLEYNAAFTNAGIILKAVATAGHDNDKYKAEDKVYDSLPSCCKYRAH